MSAIKCRQALFLRDGWLMLQAGAPMSARENLHEGADKKNPGEEGYGSLQGRATASYSPYATRSNTAFSSGLSLTLLKAFGMRTVCLKLDLLCHLIECE